VAITIAALMAWFGSQNLSAEVPVWRHLLYWGFFLAALVVAMYVVILDIRYIRLQYLVAQRDIYLDTVGSEEFRKALLAAQQEEQKNPDKSASGHRQENDV